MSTIGGRPGGTSTILLNVICFSFITQKPCHHPDSMLGKPVQHAFTTAAMDPDGWSVGIPADKRQGLNSDMSSTWQLQVMQELLGNLTGQVATDRRRFRIISSRQGGRPQGPAPTMPAAAAPVQHRYNITFFGFGCCTEA